MHTRALLFHSLSHILYFYIRISSFYHLNSLAVYAIVVNTIFVYNLHVGFIGELPTSIITLEYYECKFTFSFPGEIYTFICFSVTIKLLFWLEAFSLRIFVKLLQWWSTVSYFACLHRSCLCFSSEGPLSWVEYFWLAGCFLSSLWLFVPLPLGLQHFCSITWWLPYGGSHICSSLVAFKSPKLSWNFDNLIIICFTMGHSIHLIWRYLSFLDLDIPYFLHIGSVFSQLKENLSIIIVIIIYHKDILMC